jgi:hypothetical protein
MCILEPFDPDFSEEESYREETGGKEDRMNRDRVQAAT